jgi:O-methyltransferase
MSDVVKNNVPGDFIEAGVYNGGTVILMLGFLRSIGINDRVVWAADSFAGIPQPKRYTDIDDPVSNWTYRMETGLEEVKSNIFRYGLSSANIRYIEGFFADALPKAPLGQIEIARLDADAYESTRDALDHLYPRLSEKGYVIIDDWHIDACQQACFDFRKEHEITDPIVQVVARSSASTYSTVEAFWRVDSNPLALH